MQHVCPAELSRKRNSQEIGCTFPLEAMTRESSPTESAFAASAVDLDEASFFRTLVEDTSEAILTLDEYRSHGLLPLVHDLHVQA